jgi:predicted RNA-binding protein
VCCKRCLSIQAVSLNFKMLGEIILGDVNFTEKAEDRVQM